MVNAALAKMDALLSRSDRQLMEQVPYNLLFLWCIGLSVADEVWVWVPSVFTKIGVALAGEVLRHILSIWTELARTLSLYLFVL